MAHQVVSLEHNDRSPIVFDTSDPGTGKTFVRITAYAKRRAKGAGCMLVLAPRSLLRSVWLNDFKKFAPNLKVSVADAANREEAFAEDADVYVTNVDASKWLAAQKPTFFKKFTEFAIDECFPAGTLVDTPFGQRPIELIKIGDRVNTSAGPLPVTNTFVSQSNLLVRLELDNGTEIYCTENHPIATSEGWRNAGDCDGLFAVQLDFHELAQSRAALLRQKMREDGFLGERISAGTGSPSGEDGRVAEGQDYLEQRHSVPGRNKSQTQRSAQVDRASTNPARGQRSSGPMRNTGGGNAPGDMGAAIRHSDETAPRQRVSDLLQSGLCQPEAQEGAGDRRQFTHIAQTLGCQEGRISGLSRVVSVSRHELGDPVHVYNLQVDGPHDYSVENTLVHNCTAFKHHTSARSKAMAKIARMKNFTHRCCMTGTPNGRSITDVWHQVFLLDGGARLGNSFYRFREAVCAPKQVGRDPNAIHWTDKEGAEEVVFGLLADIVIRHKFEDCVDIPPNHRYSVGYELTAKQRRAYDEMENTQMLLLEKSNDMVLAINAASVATKLQQIASGAVYNGQGGYALIDTARYEMILDLVEQRKHSLVLFLWQHQRDALLAEADKRGVTFATIDGSTSDRERHEIVQGYQAGVYQVLFGHPKTIAHGYTLTRGTTTIWASPTYDTELDAQGSKRQHRIGQTEKTETITIVAQGTIDEKVHAMMTEKRGRMLNLLDLFGTLNRPAVPRETTKRKVKETV